MGEKDLSEKILADYNDVFADIVNVLILKGGTSDLAGRPGGHGRPFTVQGRR